MKSKADIMEAKRILQKEADQSRYLRNRVTELDATLAIDTLDWVLGEKRSLPVVNAEIFIATIEPGSEGIAYEV